MDANTYNELTEAFHKETGIWPPGRDMPSVKAPEHTDEYRTRMLAFDNWRKQKDLQDELVGLLGAVYLQLTCDTPLDKQRLAVFIRFQIKSLHVWIEELDKEPPCTY